MALGYHVTLVRDATAALTKERLHAAHELTGPTYAHAILKASELMRRCQKPSTLRRIASRSDGIRGYCDARKGCIAGTARYALA